MSPLAGDNSPVSSFAPVYDENRVTIWQGDVRTVLAALPAESVQCVVTSPPYWGLRDYGTGTWIDGDAECDHSDAKLKGRSDYGFSEGRDVDQNTNASAGFPRYRSECKCGAKRVDNQIGLEATPEEYIAAMVAVFREVRRVLRHDGTLWLNMGDSYWNGGGEKRDGGHGFVDGGKQKLAAAKGALLQPKATTGLNLKPKDLVGMPWMLAFALRADGWYLRSDIIWAKPNPMPESVTDRPTKAHEYIFLLTKSERYFYDADAIRETTGSEMSVEEYAQKTAPGATWESGGMTQYAGANKHDGGQSHPGGRNKRSVWEVATQAFPDAHFATFPEALIQPCILAGTSEKGCCAHCGAPWRRIVDRDEVPADRFTNTALAGDGFVNTPRRGGKPHGSGQKVQDWLNENPPRTIGWEPTCECKSAIVSGGLQVEPAPCTVLDPFFGSGTTALVARKNGCRAIGVELNPAYIEIAKRRIRQSVLPF